LHDALPIWFPSRGFSKSALHEKWRPQAPFRSCLEADTDAGKRAGQLNIELVVVIFVVDRHLTITCTQLHHGELVLSIGVEIVQRIAAVADHVAFAANRYAGKRQIKANGQVAHGHHSVDGSFADFASSNRLSNHQLAIKLACGQTKI